MNEDNCEISVFTAKARDMGGSLVLTLDSKIAKYDNIEKGDLVRVWVKKMPRKEVE